MGALPPLDGTVARPERRHGGRWRGRHVDL